MQKYTRTRHTFRIGVTATVAMKYLPVNPVYLTSSSVLGTHTDTPRLPYIQLAATNKVVTLALQRSEIHRERWTWNVAL